MQRLTPFDHEAIVMLESLTECSVCPSFGDNDNFKLYAFYGKHNTPEYISAIIDAARGRYGERFVEVSDDPDWQRLEFTIAYDKHEYPKLQGDYTIETPHPNWGTEYCHQLEEIRAIQVKRWNVEQLQIFVGGGQMATYEHPGGKAVFSFINNGTFVDVPEDSYIVKREKSNVFEIWPADMFEKEWEPKN